MASKGEEAVNCGESEGDSLSSQKGIAEESTKSERVVSQRTYSTSEVDREEKKSSKILAEFFSRSPVVNVIKSFGHAPILPQGSGPVSAKASMTMDSNTVCKKKLPDTVTSSSAFYSPPVRHRPNDLSPTSRPRSRSVPHSTVSN